MKDKAIKEEVKGLIYNVIDSALSRDMLIVAGYWHAKPGLDDMATRCILDKLARY